MKANDKAKVKMTRNEIIRLAQESSVAKLRLEEQAIRLEIAAAQKLSAEERKELSALAVPDDETSRFFQDSRWYDGREITIRSTIPYTLLPTWFKERQEEIYKLTDRQGEIYRKLEAARARSGASIFLDAVNADQAAASALEALAKFIVELPLPKPEAEEKEEEKS